ncbi:methylamine utilization protein [uncultured Sphingomonas sp.]|uniref:methylamine utilization protein n=1 Tax=uncultured Sphingomonas sp. TaxID=158754 RepID=UPI0035CC83CF
MTIRSTLLLALIALAASQGASAATVTLDVRGPDGRPLADAVVMIDVPGHASAVPQGPYVMEQKAIAFQPHVLVVPVGASVSFPNRDTVRHHVYSFSKAKRFDLKLYGREDQRSVVFDKPGVVALGCNIHDTMSGFIIVSASPFTGRTNAAGHLVVADVPPGPARLTVWSPAIRQPDNMAAQMIVVPAGGVAKTIAIGR